MRTDFCAVSSHRVNELKAIKSTHIPIYVHIYIHKLLYIVYQNAFLFLREAVNNNTLIWLKLQNKLGNIVSETK